MKENTWLPDQPWEEHEAPTIADTVGTDIRARNDGVVTVERAQDVEPILERCKELARSNTFRSKSNELHHLADFPAVLVEKYCVDKGITFAEFINNTVHVKAMLADPALKDFLISANATHRVYR